VSYLNFVAGAMLQLALLSLPDICSYTLGVPLLRFCELGEALSMPLSIGSKVTSQSQKMIDFWDKSAGNLRLPLAMTAGCRAKYAPGHNLYAYVCKPYTSGSP
jgi:hypothetical protein